MIIEHRLSTRIHAPLPVVMYANGHVFAYGVSRDLNSHGLFVQVDPSRIGRNAIVEVEIPVLRMRMPAMVVHRNEEGVGLTFSDSLSPQVLRELQLLAARLHDRT